MSGRKTSAKKPKKSVKARSRKTITKANRRPAARGRINREKAGSVYKVGPGKPPVETRFKPGQSGNPNGRPKGSNLSRLIKDALEAASPVKGDPRSTGEVVIDALMNKARRGDLKATEIILDRTEGKARQRIDVGGADGQPIPISIMDTIDRFYGDGDQPATGADQGESKPS